jgi:hypothetical protein
VQLYIFFTYFIPRWQTVVIARARYILFLLLFLFLATDPEARVRFPALPGEKKVVGLERGPLSLKSTTEELLDRKVAAV